MMRMLRVLVSGLLALGLTAPAFAQTALTTTTVAAPVTASSTTIQLASATGVTAGGGLYVGREYMTVGSGYTSGTTVPVLRAGRVVPHMLSEPVLVGPVTAFLTTDRDGACTPAAEAVLPQINIYTGAVWNCFPNTGQWVDERALVVVTCRALVVADQIDQTCYTADRAYLVAKITYVATTAEAGGTLTIIPRRQTGVQAPSGGLALATAINVVAATTPAETVVTAVLTATPGVHVLHAGYRIGLDYTGDVAGELAGVTVVWYLYPL